MLPRNLVIVRHGQSLRNAAVRKAYDGDLTAFEEIITRPSSAALLTERGVQQAIRTGEWLRSQNFAFGRWYTSSYIRARQTAGLLDLPRAEWFVDNNIRERSSGVIEDMRPEERVLYLASVRNRIHILDPYNFRPESGESFADVEMRHRFFLDTLHRECGEMDVCVVSHGHCMRALDNYLRRRTPDDFLEAGTAEFPNCTVLHFTRIDPETKLPTDHLNWVRHFVPWRDAEVPNWEPIKRKRYTSQELLSQVQRTAERLAALT